jgi:hypothetical protein
LASACALSRRAASFSARFAARSAHVDRARLDDAARGTAACLVRGRRARGGGMHHARERVVGVRLGRLGLASARLVRTAPIAAVQHAGTGKDKCMSGRHPGARRGPPALAVCVHMCGSCFGGGAGLTTGRRPRHRSRTTPATGHRGADPMPLDTVGAAWTCAASRGGVLSVGARGQVCGGERRPMLTEGSRGVAGDRWSALFGHSGALPAQRRLWERR